ncbi:MAG: dihydroorotate dehydrogenase [Actinomycetota bacterium]|nr:dihydroorotate dehydrogenase [Actinomycetota bacterium]
MRVLNASGCLDALTAPDVAGALDVFVTKTVTPLPREGNAPPRIAEVEHGMLNSIGLANPGIDHFLAQALPRLAELGVPIWVSVGGFAASDYADLCDRLDDRPEVEAIELNVSCPNVDDVPASVGEIVAAARNATRKLLYTKLSPATADVAEVARAAQAAGTDGLSLVNTILGLALDERTLKPRLSRAAGGLSGPVLKPIALAAVYDCYAATGLPIVGMGGIASGRDALEFVAAGAADIALGTILFSDPGSVARIRAELADEVATLGVGSIDNAIGLAHAGATAISEPPQSAAPMSV